MKRIFTEIPEDIPQAFLSFAQQAKIYDSSCSKDARVWFLDKGPGFYLKKSPKGTLAKEAAMTAFFHQKGLAAEVMRFESEAYDWLLTRRVLGEDCTWQPYLDEPARLCDTLAQLLRKLHETSTEHCPVPNRTLEYFACAERNYKANVFSNEFLPDNQKHFTPSQVWALAEQAKPHMKADTLLHGDYCLPNIMLDRWQFSGFIDLGCGGVGDRHIDLFWGIWSLEFNLKTTRYKERFLDAYGRDVIETELLSAIPLFEAFG